MEEKKSNAGLRAKLSAINHRLNNPKFIDYVILFFIVVAIAMLFGSKVKTLINDYMGTSARLIAPMNAPNGTN